MQSESPAEEKQRRESQDGSPRDHPGGSSSANAASTSKIENFLKSDPGPGVWIFRNTETGDLIGYTGDGQRYLRAFGIVPNVPWAITFIPLPSHAPPMPGPTVLTRSGQIVLRDFISCGSGFHRTSAEAVLCVEHVHSEATNPGGSQFAAGMRYAAELVRNHWNSAGTMTNQKAQAERSANTILRAIDSENHRCDES